MCCFSQLYYMQKDRCKSVPMIPHIDLLISPWFEIRSMWSLHCWIALIKDSLSYTNHHVPFVVIDKLFSKISESTKHWDTFATHCICVRLMSRKSTVLSTCSYYCPFTNHPNCDLIFSANYHTGKCPISESEDTHTHLQRTKIAKITPLDFSRQPIYQAYQANSQESVLDVC